MLNRSRHLGSKQVGSLSIDKRVGIAVSSHLVTRFGNLTDNFGMTFGHVTEHKKGGAGASFGEHVQQSPSGLNNAVLVARPFGVRNLEALVPVLKINSQGVSD